MLMIPAASVLAIYLGCLWLLPGLCGFLAALLASTLFLASYAVTASTELAPHQLFVFCSLCSLCLLGKAVATGRRAYWYGAVFMTAIAFCTLEIALVLILTVGISGYLERGRLRADWTFARRSVALFLATVLVLWPAAILKLLSIRLRTRASRASARFASVAGGRAAVVSQPGDQVRSQVPNDP